MHREESQILRLPKVKLCEWLLVHAFELHVEYLINKNHLPQSAGKMIIPTLHAVYKQEFQPFSSVHVFGKDTKRWISGCILMNNFFLFLDIKSGEASSWTSVSYYSFPNTSDIIIISRSPKQLILDGNITHSRYDNRVCNKMKNYSSVRESTDKLNSYNKSH